MEVATTIPELTTDLNIIASLSDRPNTDDGLSAAQLKAKFDEAGNAIKTYINGSLIPAALPKPDFSGIVKSTGGTLSAAAENTDYAAALHAARHAAGGADAITPAAIGAATPADLAEHTEDTDNPHAVTWSQTGLAANQVRAIHVGTDSPDPELGNEGDIYIQYSVPVEPSA